MLHSSDIVAPDKRTPGVAKIDPVIFPVLDKLYARRIQRLSTQADALGENGEYFRFLVHLVQAQQQYIAQNPLGPDEAATVRTLLDQKRDHAHLQASLLNIPYWQAAYTALVGQVAPILPSSVGDKLAALSADKEQLAHTATHLLHLDYSQVDAGVSVVLWAALSTCWAQAVSLGQTQDLPPSTTQSAHCPCCNAPPVASLVLGGAREGLRYLQCSLCEARWHRVRAVCVDCRSSGQIEHWTLDDAKSAIQIETCGDCTTYIKTFRLDYDPELEAVADDLGSLSLDAAIETEGFKRVGLNPFSFPV